MMVNAVTSTRLVAGHTIEWWSDRCETCGRSVNDILSSAEGASYGDPGVACSGGLTQIEMQQLAAERERRARIFGGGA